MNKNQLEVVALAASHDFGQSELAGIYHNMCLNSVLESPYTPQRLHTFTEAGAFCGTYLKTISPDIFGKIDKKSYLALVKLGTVDLPAKAVPTTVWKHDKRLSEKGNEQMDVLIKLIHSFSSEEKNILQMKTELVNWQLQQEKLSEIDKAVLSVAGSIARYSGSFWVSHNPQGSPQGKKRCIRDVVTVAADVLFGAAGAVGGFVAGGPVGAVIGGVAFGSAGSVYTRIGPARG